MIAVHKETPHTRMTRLSEAAKVELKKEPIEKPTMNAQQPKIFDCSECGCILKCKTGLEEHIGSEHKVKPTEDITPTLSVYEIKPEIPDTDDEEDEEEEEKDEVQINHYTDKVWGKDESTDGYVMTGKSVEFQNAVDRLKVALKKGAKLYNDNVNVEVKDVTEKSSIETVAVIEINEKKNRGSVRLTYWAKNKKTKLLKLQVCNISGHDKLFVAVFTEKILKSFLDMVLSGGITKAFFKNPLNKTVLKQFPCETCGENLKSKEHKTMHMNTVHKNHDAQTNLQKEFISIASKGAKDMKQMIHDVSKTPVKRMKCKHCNSEFINENALEGHIKDQHGDSSPNPNT